MSLGLLLALASEGVVVSAARGRFTSEVGWRQESAALFAIEAMP